MPIITPAELEAIKPDYIIIGGGTAGLTLAARYVLATANISVC